MKFSKWVALLICIPCLSVASSTELEGFDFKNCSHWYFSDDSYPEPSVNLDGNKKYLQAAAILSKRYPNYHKNDWSIFSAYDMVNPKSVGKYGGCKFSDDARKFECLEGFDFPLSGASFTIIKYKGELSTYKCQTNCTSIEVQQIHDVGYENMEGERNIEHEIMMRKFQKVCRKKMSK